MTSSTVTCSFKMDRGTYDKFKSVVTASGQNVKGNLVRYMQDVIAYGTPNPETIEAIKEVDKLKKNPHLCFLLPTHERRRERRDRE